jgi:hypothetical protein
MLRMTDPVPVDPVDTEDAMPLPTDPKVIYLGGGIDALGTTN